MLDENTLQTINKQTSRHIGKVLNYLTSVGVDEKIIQFVKKELWFIHDDILESIFENKNK